MTERMRPADPFAAFQHATTNGSLTQCIISPISPRMVRSRLTIPFAFERDLPDSAPQNLTPACFSHCVRRAVVTACWNNACMAAVISPSVVTEKNRFEDAQFCRLGPIWL